MATIGASLVLNKDLSISPQIGLGTLFGLFAAIFYAVYYLVTQRGRAYLDTMEYYWLCVSSASILLFLITVIFNHSLFGYNKLTFLNFLVLGLIVQLFGWFIINYSQGLMSAPIVAPSLLGQPVITTIFVSQ